MNFKWLINLCYMGKSTTVRNVQPPESLLQALALSVTGATLFSITPLQHPTLQPQHPVTLHQPHPHINCWLKGRNYYASVLLCHKNAPWKMSGEQCREGEQQQYRQSTGGSWTEQTHILIEAGGSTLPVNILTLVLLNITQTKHE